MPDLAFRATEFSVGSQLSVNHTSQFVKGAVWQRIWSRHAAATLWPEGNYDTVLLPLPMGKGNLHYCLQAVASTLNEDGQVLLFGDNDLGIRTAGKLAEIYYNEIESIYTGGHGRIWKLQKPKCDLKKDPATFEAGEPPYVSYPGLFAGGKLDEATDLLLKNIPIIAKNAEVLDFACGIGFIAHAAKAQQPECYVTVIDNNPLALLATSKNLPEASQQLCGDPTAVTGAFDIILSNPPIHEGKELSFSIVYDLIQSMPTLLKKGGAAYIVAQVTVPIARIAHQMKLKSEEVAASRSFRVTKISADGL